MRATVHQQFTPQELRLIFDALLDARLVLQAVNGGALFHTGEPPIPCLELGEEINRLEAALLLVAAS